MGQLTLLSERLRVIAASYLVLTPYSVCFFFFNDTATTEIYTLSLHDALPISRALPAAVTRSRPSPGMRTTPSPTPSRRRPRSEEHTSELQSRRDLVCRLLLEKKKKKQRQNHKSHILTHSNAVKYSELFPE